QRDEPPDHEWDDGVEQRDAEARDEHREIPALGLADEMPVEAEERLRRRAGRRSRSGEYLETRFLQGSVVRRGCTARFVLGATTAGWNPAEALKNSSLCP